MKRLVLVICCVLFLLSMMPSAFAAQDLTTLSTDELMALKEKTEQDLEDINRELEARASAHKTSIKPGDTVVFGKFEQDNDLSNGPEDIEWSVLSIGNGKALIVSTLCLDAKPYHDEKKSVRWETCSVRNWLNDEFYYTAFSEDEQEAVVESFIDNSTLQGGEYITYAAANDTTDRVFLLSGKDAEEYLGRHTNCKYTARAKANGAQVDGYECSWWLRGVTSVTIDGVTGKIEATAQAAVPGLGVANSYSIDKTLGVRPALWVNISAIENSVIDAK